MVLLEILKTNGTGLLSGLCRPQNKLTFFDVLKNKTTQEMVASPLMVDFSLNENHVGTYECLFYAMNSKDQVYLQGKNQNFEVSGRILSHPDLPEGHRVMLKITYRDNKEFCKFKAILKSNPV